MNDTQRKMKETMDKALANNHRNVPATTAESLERYVLYGIPAGGFVTAVLENNLIGAVARADSTNAAHLTSIVIYVYNVLPFKASGSHDSVVNWVSSKGLTFP